MGAFKINHVYVEYYPRWTFKWHINSHLSRPSTNNCAYT